MNSVFMGGVDDISLAYVSPTDTEFAFSSVQLCFDFRIFRERLILADIFHALWDKMHHTKLIINLN